MSNIRALLAMGLVGMLLLAGPAAAERVDRMPGYVDLESIEVPADAHEVRDFDLGPSLLQLAADTEGKQGAHLKRLLEGIHAIRVKSFSLEDDESPRIRRQIDGILDDLKHDDWKSLVHIKDGDELVQVKIKHGPEKIAGMLLVMYSPGDEVTLANIVGHLDLGAIAGLALGLNGDGLEDLIEEIEEIEEMEGYRGRQERDE